MLQQTQVATVIPYYHKFLAALPTVHALSTASLDAILKIWQGLGYYARARSLHRAARIIVEQFGGIVPMTLQELVLLPGIGRSSAGAILNIAYLQRHPILDGNVQRILLRYFCIRGDPKEKKINAMLWGLAKQILPASRVNLFTQAIMDLGAMICLPKTPNCSLCPIQQGCQAYQKGIQETLPFRPVSKKLPHYDHVAVVIQKGESVLIRKRPENGLLGGLWEFPGGRVTTDFSETIQKEMGQKVVLTPWFEIKQTFTHFKMTLYLLRGRMKKTKMPPPFQWVEVDQLFEYPFSLAHHKIVLKLQND